MATKGWVSQDYKYGWADYKGAGNSRRVISLRQHHRPSPTVHLLSWLSLSLSTTSCQICIPFRTFDAAVDCCLGSLRAVIVAPSPHSLQLQPPELRLSLSPSLLHRRHSGQQSIQRPHGTPSQLSNTNTFPCPTDFRYNSTIDQSGWGSLCSADDLSSPEEKLDFAREPFLGLKIRGSHSTTQLPVQITLRQIIVG